MEFYLDIGHRCRNPHRLPHLSSCIAGRILLHAPLAVCDNSNIGYRKPILPIECELQPCASSDSESGLDVESYRESVSNVKKNLYSRAENNIRNAQARYKKDYDKKHLPKKVSVNVTHIMICIA